MFRHSDLYGAFVKMSNAGGVASVADNENPARMPVLASLRVESIDETSGKVVGSGGRVFINKTALAGGTFGYFARYIDTEGNLIAVWQGPEKEEEKK